MFCGYIFRASIITYTTFRALCDLICFTCRVYVDIYINVFMYLCMCSVCTYVLVYVVRVCVCVCLKHIRKTYSQIPGIFLDEYLKY